MSDVDLSVYDLEFAELVHLSKSENAGDLTIVIRCPKQPSLIGSLTRVFRRVRYSEGDFRDLQLCFSSISNVDESLMSQGYQLGQVAPQQWPEALMHAQYEVRDVSRHIDTEDGGRFHLEVEGFYLDFNYEHCAAHEGSVVADAPRDRRDERVTTGDARKEASIRYRGATVYRPGATASCRSEALNVLRTRELRRRHLLARRAFGRRPHSRDVYRPHGLTATILNSR